MPSSTLIGLNELHAARDLIQERDNAVFAEYSSLNPGNLGDMLRVLRNPNSAAESPELNAQLEYALGNTMRELGLEPDAIMAYALELAHGAMLTVAMTQTNPGEAIATVILTAVKASVQATLQRIEDQT